LPLRGQRLTIFGMELPLELKEGQRETFGKRLAHELALTVKNATNERPIQRFIETHPAVLLPRPRYVLGDALISQFPLGADFKADFAFAFFNSTGVFLELIEIESPKIQMFTQQDEFSRPFAHALQQAEDWLEWSQRNQPALLGILAPLLKGHETWQRIGVTCRVIAGERSQRKNVRRERRYTAKSEQLKPKIEILTYDRLVDEAKFITEAIGARCVSYKSQSYFEKETERLRRERVEEFRKLPGMEINEPDF
jgi:hypothetical protein